MALTTSSLTITPLTSSDNCTLLVADGYRGDGGYDSKGFKEDPDFDQVYFSVKTGRSSASSGGVGNTQVSTLTISDSNGYEFVPEESIGLSSSDKFNW